LGFRNLLDSLQQLSLGEARSLFNRHNLKWTVLQVAKELLGFLGGYRFPGSGSSASIAMIKVVTLPLGRKKMEGQPTQDTRSRFLAIASFSYQLQSAASMGTEKTFARVGN
jgi:hypothetical protein